VVIAKLTRDLPIVPGTVFHCIGCTGVFRIRNARERRERRDRRELRRGPIMHPGKRTEDHSAAKPQPQKGIVSACRGVSVTACRRIGVQPVRTEQIRRGRSELPRQIVRSCMSAVQKGNFGTNQKSPRFFLFAAFWCAKRSLVGLAE
jgi:hypothetical protein